MDSFADFYAATKDTVFRTVLAATGDRWGAQDAVSEAYVRALQHWPHLSHMDNPAGWVIVTAMNLRRSVWRRLRREVLGTPPEPLGEAATDAGDLPVAVRAAVNRLPRRQREVLALRVLADLSGEQVADLLGISSATVHVHLHRAVQELRLALGQASARHAEEVKK